jgi:hypothetical protein
MTANPNCRRRYAQQQRHHGECVEEAMIHAR